MIEYKTRRRTSNPQKGDKVWIEGKIPDKPMAQGANGTVVLIKWQDREVIILLDGKQVTMEMDELQNCWCDGLNSYIVEEPYVEKDQLNGDDS